MLKPVSFLALGGISNKDQVCNEVLKAANLPCHTEHLKQDLQRILKLQVIQMFQFSRQNSIKNWLQTCFWHENSNTDSKMKCLFFTLKIYIFLIFWIWILARKFNFFFSVWTIVWNGNIGWYRIWRGKIPKCDGIF